MLRARLIAIPALIASFSAITGCGTPEAAMRLQSVESESTKSDGVTRESLRRWGEASQLSNPDESTKAQTSEERNNGIVSEDAVLPPDSEQEVPDGDFSLEVPPPVTAATPAMIPVTSANPETNAIVTPALTPAAAAQPNAQPETQQAAQQVAQPTTVDDVLDACTSGTKVTRTVKVEFAENTGTCAFGTAGNSSRLDGKVRARLEKYVNIALPENDLICDVRISSANQSLKFDDEIFLTFNNIILLSSYNYNNRFSVVSGAAETPAYQYSWQKLIGGFNPGQQHADGGYCLGEGQLGSSCNIPVTQTVGNFALELGQRESAFLGLSAASSKQAKVGFIVTGDNDSSDCKHSKISVDVHLTSAQTNN